MNISEIWLRGFQWRTEEFIGFVTLKDIKNIAKNNGETQGYPRS